MMRTALKAGAMIHVNGVDYRIQSLLSAGGGMSLIYEASQVIAQDGFAGRTVIKEFFPASNAIRNREGRVCCASQEPQDIERFESLRRSMTEEGVIGEEARQACSQVYAFDHAWDGYAVMRRLSGDTHSLADILKIWQTAPPATDEEYADMARVRYALKIVHSLLTGLQTIHQNAGIIHRDISLGNIVWASADFEKDGREGRAYFLDFGSALRMDEARTARNPSDPLRLFGTYSFAAPEIWQTGAVLTPSADLFSVAALLLLLCCGKKCCIRMMPGWQLASQSNIARLYENDFVVRSALEKLNIPPDIRGRLYDLLIEGLAREPAARFEQSALKMLEAVETLQIKCAPRQRLREYVAFISYHHRPLDRAVARKLHRSIEHYVIPKELAGDRENRRLGRVFRDEDELPVSTDLTENIREALDHSDWLIVICTPGTPGSIWVEQEIAYFLRHHDRNHILAVLAEGRPEESFPPHLVHLYDEKGQIVGDTEYLAANIAGRSPRAVMSRLRRERLRIIAAMLGCPFDSLVQREKRYQIQRVAALSCLISVALFGFLAVVLCKDMEIREKNRVIGQQYQEVLINESNALSREAQLEYQRGHVVDALECALKAVPDDANGRPYTALSEQVLSDILTPYTFGDAAIRSIIRQETEIASIELSPEQGAVYSLDPYGTIRAFDLNSGALRWRRQLSVSSLLDQTVWMKLIPERGSLLIHTDREIDLIDGRTGQPVWRREAINTELLLSDDHQVAAILDKDWKDGQSRYVLRLCAIDDGSELCAVDCGAVALSNTLMSLQYTATDIASEGAFPDKDHFWGISYDVNYDHPATAELVVYGVAGGGAPAILHRETLQEEEDGLYRPTALRYYAADDSLLMICVNHHAQKMQLQKLSAADGHALYTREYAWPTLWEARRRCFMSTDTRAFLALNNDLFCFDVATGALLAQSMNNSSDFIALTAAPGVDNGGFLVTKSGIHCIFACISDDIVYGNFRDQRLNLGAVDKIALGGQDCIVPIAGGNFAMGHIARLNERGRVAVVPEGQERCILIFQPRLVRDGHIEGLNMYGGEYHLDDTGRFVIDRSVQRLFDLEDRRYIDLPDYFKWSGLDDILYAPDRQTITYLMNGQVGTCSLEDGGVSVFGLPEIEGDYPRRVSMALDESGAAVVALFDRHTLHLWRDGAPMAVVQPTEGLEMLDARDEYYVRVLTDGRYVVISNLEDDQHSGLMIYHIGQRQWKEVACKPLSEHASAEQYENAICVSGGQGQLAYISADNELTLCDLERGALSHCLPMAMSDRIFEDMRFIDSGRRLVCLGQDRVTVCDTRTGALRDCEYRHSYMMKGLCTEACHISTDDRRGRLYVCGPMGNADGICIDIDSWTRIATIPCQLGYSARFDSLLIYDFPGYWHPNIVDYGLLDILEKDEYGICAVPSKGLEDLRRHGMEVISYVAQ